MAYSILLHLHSWLRWGVLLLGVVTLIAAFQGWKSMRAWTPADARLQMWFIRFLEVQFLIGVVLFIISPLVRSAFADFGAAMKTGAIRFFIMEHTTLMLASVAVAHIFSSRAKKQALDRKRHSTWLVGIVVTLLLIFAAVPWPFLPYGRPLFRF